MIVTFYEKPTGEESTNRARAGRTIYEWQNELQQIDYCSKIYVRRPGFPGKEDLATVSFRPTRRAHKTATMPRDRIFRLDQDVSIMKSLEDLNVTDGNFRVLSAQRLADGK
ncbi:MAG: hypothetical protein ABIR70_07775 [Bryobacteraceae bacterium]